MTTYNIIELAREAGLGTLLTHNGGEPRVWIEGADWHDELTRFAALVRNAVLEECASEFEGQYTDSCPGTNISAAIRALVEERNELAKDAARYRCLSAMATQQADSLGPIFRIDVRRSESCLFNFDAAVDAALQAENERLAEALPQVNLAATYEPVETALAAQAQPKRRRYDPSGSLSEHGIFPECDACSDWRDE